MSTEYTSEGHVIVVKVARSSSMVWNAHIACMDGMSSYYVVSLHEATSEAAAMAEALEIAHLRHPPTS